MLSLLLAVPSCIYSFWHGVTLHPASFLMIFILVSLIFYPGLTLTERAVSVRAHPLIRSMRATRITYTYVHVHCAGSCDVYVQSTIKWF